MEEKEILEERQVSFREIDDLTSFTVKTEDGKALFYISGYGLTINFNRDMLNSVEDVEAMLDGIKDLFRKMVMKSLLPDNK
ncbi:MAG: hypothetical protein IKO36_04690 [Bacteroidaceae bacterium]|nr:hypothetical protein [Bacteroidaceae bacterium]